MNPSKNDKKNSIDASGRGSMQVAAAMQDAFVAGSKDMLGSLLGGMSAAEFMRDYWQKRPLLIRGAIAGFQPLLTQQDLARLASSEGVESRYIRGEGQSWHLEHGPFESWPIQAIDKKGKNKKAPNAQPQTVLVQGVDTLSDDVHALMQLFRFVPDARLDDVMISYASEGGSVGAHFDSYDVFLLQASGRRRWQISENSSLELLPDMPLKLLADFEPEKEWVLEPGDMLYLPPQYAHHGVALDDGCQTYSIGFRAPEQIELAADLAQRLGEWVMDEYDDSDYVHYQDATQLAVPTSPAAIPVALQRFATQTIAGLLKDGKTLDMLLGESLTEPKPNVQFSPAQGADAVSIEEVKNGVVLHRATRMMYDANYVFANGESWQASGAEAAALQQLANARELTADELQRTPEAVLGLLDEWLSFGWLLPQMDTHS